MGHSNPGDPSNTQQRAQAKPSLALALKRSAAQFHNDNMTTLAAALTYNALLSVVPGLIAVFTLLGVFGKHVTSRVVSSLKKIAPGSSAHIIHTLLTQAQANKTGSGIVAIVGFAVALWSASSYVSTFRQASNAVYGIGEGRPAWKTLPLRLVLTVVAVVLLVLCALIVVVSGSVADVVGNTIGAGHTVVVIWEILKWPVLLVLVSVLLAILYWASPNAKQGRISWVSKGSLVATVLWIIASGLFALYVATFASYNKTYGPLAGIVIFLIWLWLTNISVLFGAEVNAELQHAEAIRSGVPEDVRPFAEPRDTRKLGEREKKSLEEVSALREG